MLPAVWHLPYQYFRFSAAKRYLLATSYLFAVAPLPKFYLPPVQIILHALIKLLKNIRF